MISNLILLERREKMQKTKKRKGKGKMWIVVLVIVGGVAAVLLGGFFFTGAGRREINDLIIGSVDFKKLRDGIFTGEYIGVKDHLRDTTVEVTVKDGEVSNVRVVKGAVDKNGKPVELTHGKTVDDLYKSVLSSKSLSVDVVSGATLTSKTHLKALENALKKAEAM
jgi:uncharacterized protein with FMN-binding domain